jgi:ribosomal protein S18 acetylase RimI-like enzyme
LDGENDQIRPLSIVDLDSAIEITSRAFHSDPLWQYLVPDDKKRERLLPRFFKVFLTFGIRSRQAYGVSSPLEGVGVWCLPGQDNHAFRGLVKAGFLKLLVSPLLMPIMRAFPIFTKFEAMQKKYAPEPHYQLRSVAVAPDSQGKGLASKLIKPFLAQADEHSMSVYTETMTPSNVGFYEHFGFQCKEEYPVQGTELRIWALCRPARG